MKVLALNAGSSSLKYHLYQMPTAEPLAKGIIDSIGKDDSSFSYCHREKVNKLSIRVSGHKEGVALILKQLTDNQEGAIEELKEIDAVGHRVVHGGEEFTEPVLINDKIVASLQRLTDLAPLHNVPGVNSIETSRKMLYGIPHVACFDTAFHSTIPAVAYTYGLPFEICREYGIRRYGFHGLSHQYVAGRAAMLLGKKKNDISAITCHLGNGCSITAVRNGQSIDTSMGFTPLEGLVMGTRSGDFDPTVIFYLMDKGYDYKYLNTLLNGESGLVGISGISNDMRTLLKLAEQGHSRAKLAIDVFTYRIKKYIGAYVAVIKNLEALVFTGGIGENASEVRMRVCQDISHIGIELNEAQNKNTVHKEDYISNSNSCVKVLVIPTNEEMVIADKTFTLTKT
jgi:acetate kinase